MAQETDTISKKELLELTGISYGQLYRWKRKGLIPEAWFVKKAAFTGQETFFPRAEILERVERIQGLKEDLNLDELAGLLSPGVFPAQVARADLENHNIVSNRALDLLDQTLGCPDPLGFPQAFQAWVADRLLEAGAVNREEAALILRTLGGLRSPAPPDQGQLLFLRKYGVGFCFLTQGEAVLDPEARVAARIDLPAQVAELKLALKPLNGGKP